MNLIIDVGNTCVKLAVFSNDVLISKSSVKVSCLLKELVSLRDKYPAIRQSILSSVGKISSQDLAYLKNTYNLVELSAHSVLPFLNKYETPKTLGVDRIALVCAAVKHSSNQNILVIDAGTCITYDFINKNNEYLGGAISPGLATRYKSLNNLTANLPLLDLQFPKSITGASTKQAIHSGVVYGVLNEIDGIIATYRSNYSDLTVILTGGDSNFLSKQLKSTIFANSNFLLEGLNYILQFNKNQ